MNRYVCIHGHFYQPPRENPWLEEIETQESAAPYHDWNERITRECYMPNSASRILDPKRKIKDIVNNYSRMSFNFGPTLLFWMETATPQVYRSILESDRESQQQFSGHGCALAQGYNHMIMPLSNDRDKNTQTIWGIRDFEYRFKRKPEGMWLPEAAVDVDTLELLAQHGMKFTILSPRQARRYRKIGEKAWKDVRGEHIDPRRPYRYQLPSGHSIVIFFYDGALSQEVAFSDLLNSGENLAHRLQKSFTDDPENQLVHIASDGETYGHHHRFGDMALAYCFYHLENEKLAQLTVYGEYLEKFPPAYEVKIYENSSWSCVHGIDRWRSNCGCNSGMHVGWQQEWRAPLRDALDWLRDALVPVYEKGMNHFAADCWQVRNEYIDVILDRSEGNVQKFLEKNLLKKVSSEEKVRVIKLLELQRHAMLMYTSCGWFFDEISGIETVQIMQYAAHCMKLAKDLTGVDLEPHFIDRLKHAPSNIAEYGNGALIYAVFVKPTVIDLYAVGVHYAVSSLFEKYEKTTRISSYSIKQESFEQKNSEQGKLAIGTIEVESLITGERDRFNYVVYHLGGYNLDGGIRRIERGENPQLPKDINDAFTETNIPELNRLINQHFGPQSYSLWNLFKSQQEKVLNQILDPTLQELKTFFHHIYENHYPLLQTKQNPRMSLPLALSSTVEFVLNWDLRELLQKEELDLDQLRQLVNEVKQWSFEMDNASLSFVASQRIAKMMQKLWDNPNDVNRLEKILNSLKILSELPLVLDIWEAQNIYFLLGKKVHDQNENWKKVFSELGHYLEVKGS